MIQTDDTHLLFIEPLKPASKKPVEDELTAKMRELWSDASRSPHGYYGFHLCVCGARSDNFDWYVRGGLKTNSLAVHYLEYHRAEVPKSELEKLRRL